MGKEIKQAIMDYLKERIAYENDGMMSGYKMNPQSSMIIWRNKIKVAENAVYMDGLQVATIRRRYAARKTNGCYRQLNPVVEYKPDSRI